MLMKFCPKCRKLIMQGNIYCDKCQAIVDADKAERKAISNAKAFKKYNQTKRKPAYVQFYRSNDWKTLRAVKLSQSDYLCQLCKAKGIITLAADVHHIEPISEAWDRRLDIDNLQCLCVGCHNQVHERWGKHNHFTSSPMKQNSSISIEYED